MAKRKRSRQRLEPHELDRASFLLADGLSADVVAERLGVDVRAVAHLLEHPAFGDQSDLDRALAGYRNAVTLYEVERDRLLRLSKLVPGDVPPNGQREKALGYHDIARTQSETVRRHLDTVLRWADHVRALGGRVDSGGIRELHLSVVGGERGDVPSLAGEVVSDGRTDDDDDSDD